MTRVYGDELDIHPPKSLPRWMIAPEYLQSQSQPHPELTTSTGGGTQDSFDSQDYGPMYVDFDCSVWNFHYYLNKKTENIRKVYTDK